MITKICVKCETEYPADTGFYARDKTCKECRKSEAKANRMKNIDYWREYDRARANNPDRVKARAEYAKTPEGIAAGCRAKKRWLRVNAKKRRVHCMVNNAIRDGTIVKPSFCEGCGTESQRIEGHHDDYDKPMEVRWFCSPCHKQWHNENGEGLNGA